MKRLLKKIIFKIRLKLDKKLQHRITMQAKARQLADEMSEAIGPLMMKNPQVGIIAQAAAVLMARISQGCSGEVSPFMVHAEIKRMSDQALQQLLDLENAKKKQDAVVDSAIAGFDQFAGKSDAGASPQNEEPTNTVSFEKPE